MQVDRRTEERSGFKFAAFLIHELCIDFAKMFLRTLFNVRHFHLYFGIMESISIDDRWGIANLHLRD